MLFFILLAILQVDNSADNWISIQPPGIGAKIEMPTLPQFVENTIRPVQDRDEITVRSRSASLPNNKANLTFSYHDEQQTPNSRDQIKAVLDGAVSGAIALVNGELLIQNEIFLKNHKGRDVIYRCELDDAKLQTTHRLKIRTRIILVKNRLYSMNYIAEENAYEEEIATRFFESFELVDTPGDLPPKPRAGRARELAEQK